MINISSPEECCGCTACASICPHDAISMQPDALGFLYPTVNLSKCTDCHLCEKVCAFNDHYDISQNLPEPEFYGVRHKDINELMKSQSGAAFIALSDWILERGGIVYGAGYEGHFRVAHKRAATKEERDEFRGSKYVQSDLTNIFKQVKHDLQNGLAVMFTGTPCQTAGLNSYIGKRLRANLYLVDLICHGVPAPNIWRDFIEYIEHKTGQTVLCAKFRDKKFGWSSHKETFTLRNGRVVQNENSYTFLFYKHVMLRQSCGICHYTNTSRPSDITIGDFWGYEKTDSNLGADNKGLSIMLLNTEKGKSLFMNVKKNIIATPCIKDNCLQANLCHPSILNNNRSNFEKDYIKYGLKYVMRKYGDKGIKNKLMFFRGNIIRIIKIILIKTGVMKIYRYYK